MANGLVVDGSHYWAFIALSSGANKMVLFMVYSFYRSTYFDTVGGPYNVVLSFFHLHVETANKRILLDNEAFYVTCLRTRCASISLGAVTLEIVKAL